MTSCVPEARNHLGFGKNFLVVALGLCGTFVQAQPTPRIFAVDMAKLYGAHYKTEEMNAKVRVDREKAQGELEKLVKEANALASEYTALIEKARNSPLASTGAKAKAEADAQGRYEEIEKKQQEMRVFKNSVQQQLSERMRNFNEILLAEISNVAVEIARKKGGNMVIDKSGPSGNGIPSFIYMDSGFEITDDVAKEMNRERPPPPANLEATAATKGLAPTAAPAAAAAGPTITFPSTTKK